MRNLEQKDDDKCLQTFLRMRAERQSKKSVAGPASGPLDLKQPLQFRLLGHKQFYQIFLFGVRTIVGCVDAKEKSVSNALNRIQDHVLRAQY